MNREKWIVGVSGGPDSMALLHWMNAKGYTVIAAHVNYHKRSTSNRDEEVVRDFCNAQNIQFSVAHYALEEVGNFQAKARTFRYDYFAKLSKQYGCQGVAVAHHLDDDIETYLLQKSKNNHRGKPGLEPFREIAGVRVWRPFLKKTKDELVLYCEQLNVPYEIDESNLELNYQRNVIRKKLKSISVEEKNELLQALYKKKEDHNEAQEIAREYAHKLNNPFDINDYNMIPESARLDALRNWFYQNGIENYKMSSAYLKQVDETIQSKKAQMRIESWTLSISYQEVCLHQKEPFCYVYNDVSEIQTEFFAIKKNGKTIEGVTLQESDFPITVRSARPDDKILLRYGSKKLNRFFIDRKIPVHRRRNWPVIENSVKEVVFVAEIGCDIHHYSNNPNLFMLKL